MNRATHLDPPLQKGEETRAPVRSSTARGEQAQSFLSPIEGEDQGEAAAAPTRGPGILKPSMSGLSVNHQVPQDSRPTESCDRRTAEAPVRLFRRPCARP